MGIGGLFDLLGNISKHWTPEKIKARARLKIKKLEKERDAILKEPSTERNVNRLTRICADIARMSEYLKEH